MPALERYALEVLKDDQRIVSPGISGRVVNRAITSDDQVVAPCLGVAVRVQSMPNAPKYPESRLC